jgi:hypothetical protein
MLLSLLPLRQRDYQLMSGRPLKPDWLADLQPLLCRSLDYADHWPRTGSGGGDRCLGVGIITVPPEMREAYHSVENDREWLPLELSRPVRVP